ncbi:MAG: hypothetical protein CMC08_10135 [Flavobacteriaceae bacterium]|nr:hypothetical protein [Flavobacteriaceae bacterium]
MKSLLVNFVFLAIATISMAQDNCIAYDGSWRYSTFLQTNTIPADFDKNAFLQYVLANDPISPNDFNLLQLHITTVKKTVPSIIDSQSVTVIANADIQPILETLSNSINFLQCIDTKCQLEDGSYGYLAVLTLKDVSIDFNKQDFIEYVASVDVLSSAHILYLETHINEVTNIFATAQSNFLQRVVEVLADAEIYPLLDKMENALEHFHCIEEGTVLNTYTPMASGEVSIFPNPITKETAVYFPNIMQRVELELRDIQGKKLYDAIYSETHTLPLPAYALSEGIYFLKIRDLQTGHTQIVKLISAGQW